MYNQELKSFFAHSNTQCNINVVKTIDGKRVGVNFDFTKSLTIARCDEVVSKLREFLGDDTINGFTAKRSVWQFEEDEEYVKNYPFLEELASTKTSEIVINYTQNAYDNQTYKFGNKEIEAVDKLNGVLITYVHSSEDAETIAQDEITGNFLEFAENKVAKVLAEQRAEYEAKRQAFERQMAEKGESIHYTPGEWNAIWADLLGDESADSKGE